MNIATILEQAGGIFCLEYEDTLGHKQTMRLEAHTYESALREAKAFLEISDNDHDSAGIQWDLE